MNTAVLHPAPAQLSREDLRVHVLEFASDPHGVFWNGGADDFLRQWDAGARFTRTFVSLRGLVIRVAMDAGHCPGEAIDQLLDDVFLPA